MSLKLLWVHDHVFYKHRGKYYSKGKIPYGFWQRYLSHFSSMTVASRVKKIEHKNNIDDCVISSGAKVSFIDLKNIRTKKFFQYKKINVNALSTAMRQCDALITRLPSENGLIAIELAKKFNVPYIVEVAGDVDLNFKNYGGLLAKLYRPIMTRNTKEAILNAPFVQYVTEKYLQSKYPTNGEKFIASNVQIDNFESEIEAIKNKRIKSLVSKRIGSIMNVSLRIKGFDVLLKSFIELKSVDSELTLHVLGVAENDKHLKILKKHNMELNKDIFFTRPLNPGREVFEWLDRIDIYVQPSYTEGLPRAMIEAMSRGCLCCGSNVGGVPELLDSEFLFIAGDFDTLSEIILKIIGLDSQAKKLISEKNLQTALRYTQEKIGAIRKEMLNKFIESFKDE